MYIHGRNSGLNTREVNIYDSYACYEDGWWAGPILVLQIILCTVNIIKLFN